MTGRRSRRYSALNRNPAASHPQNIIFCSQMDSLRPSVGILYTVHLQGLITLIHCLFVCPKRNLNLCKSTRLTLSTRLKAKVYKK